MIGGLTMIKCKKDGNFITFVDDDQNMLSIYSNDFPEVQYFRASSRNKKAIVINPDISDIKNSINFVLDIRQ
jgi:hypothetical protein